MSKDLVVYGFDDIHKMATAIARSKLFGMQNVDQAITLLLLAQAEGLHPMTAARDYHIIQGRPALKADSMLARYQQAGGKVKWETLSDEKVTCIFTHPASGSVSITWTIQMAENAGLLSKKGDMWKKYPRQLLRSRVISEGVRTSYPQVVAGVYTDEEVEQFQPDNESVNSDYDEIDELYDKYIDGVDYFFRDKVDRTSELDQWLEEKRPEIETMSQENQDRLWKYVDQIKKAQVASDIMETVKCPEFVNVTQAECDACKNTNCEVKNGSN